MIQSFVIPKSAFSSLDKIYGDGLVDESFHAQARRLHTEIAASIVRGEPLKLLFDKDGLLVNTELLRKVAWIDAFQRFGADCGLEDRLALVDSIEKLGWDEAIKNSKITLDVLPIGYMGGMTEAAVDQHILSCMGDRLRQSSQFEGDDAQMMARIRELRKEALQSQELRELLRLKDGVPELFVHLQNLRVTLREEFGVRLQSAVVTSDKRGDTEEQLKDFSIEDCFEALVCAGEAPRGKPYPDPFNVAIERLDGEKESRPGFVVGFEDASTGLASLRAVRGATVYSLFVPDLVDFDLSREEAFGVVKTSGIHAFCSLLDESIRIAREMKAYGGVVETSNK